MRRSPRHNLGLGLASSRQFPAIDRQKKKNNTMCDKYACREEACGDENESTRVDTDEAFRHAQGVDVDTSSERERERPQKRSPPPQKSCCMHAHRHRIRDNRGVNGHRSVLEENIMAIRLGKLEWHLLEAFLRQRGACRAQSVLVCRGVKTTVTKVKKTKGDTRHTRIQYALQ